MLIVLAMNAPMAHAGGSFAPTAPTTTPAPNKWGFPTTAPTAAPTTVPDPTAHSVDGDTVHLFGKVMITSDTTMSGDGSPFSTTGLKLFSPIDMWINTVRNVMYVTEFNHHKVRAIPLDGTSPVFTLIGYSAPPQNGSTTGSFLTSLLLNPRFFSQGKKTYPTLYVGDGNHRILELALETSQSSAFCGTGTDGSDFNVDRIAAKMGIAHQMFVQVSRMYFVENNGNLLKAWLLTTRQMLEKAWSCTAGMGISQGCQAIAFLSLMPSALLGSSSLESWKLKPQETVSILLCHLFRITCFFPLTVGVERSSSWTKDKITWLASSMGG